MTQDWQELTRLTQGKPVVVERVRLVEKDIAIEGSFKLPYLVRLSTEYHVFIAAFIEIDFRKQCQSLFLNPCSKRIRELKVPRFPAFTNAPNTTRQALPTLRLSLPDGTDRFCRIPRVTPETE